MPRYILIILMVAACGADAAPTATAVPEVTSRPTPTVTVVPAGPTPSTRPTTPSGPMARTDLERLISAREQLHPDPWHGITRADYQAAVDEAISGAEEMNEDELLVELTRLAALPTYAGRDGHTGIFPWGEGTYGGYMYPLRLYWFSDGVFVVDATAPYADLVGQQLTGIAGHDIADLLDAVEPLVPRDNHQQVLSESPRLIVSAAVLHGLGFIDSNDGAVEFDFSGEDGPSVRSIEPTPLAFFEGLYGGHHSLSPPTRPGGQQMWLRNIAMPAWLDIDSDGSAYLGFNVVSSEVNSAAGQLIDALDAGDVRRLLVDLRHNAGGDNTTYGQLLFAVLRAADELPEPVYVVMGRATFSAAANFVTEVETHERVLLVGEDLGGSPNNYGDGQIVHLEHSGLVLHMATSYVIRGGSADERITIAPDIPVELSSTDYFSDRDPIWEALERRED